MANRLTLHEKLCAVLGTRNVLFQPPASVRLKYPCIIYKLSDIDTKHADDRVYRATNKYSVTFISRDPDNNYSEKMFEMPYVSFDRRYIADDLYHDVFTIFF